MAGVLGGVIGFGLGDVSNNDDRSAAPLLGAIVGAVIAAGGVGIVAVLVLRAQAEWRRIDPTPRPGTPVTPADLEAGDTPAPADPASREAK